MNGSHCSDGHKWCQGSDIGAVEAGTARQGPTFLVRADHDVHECVVPRSEE